MIERFEISKGLRIPIAGEPEPTIDSKRSGQVALVSSDYIGLRPSLLVSEGDQVQLGQPVLVDKQTEGVVWVSPAGGRVAGIHRGAKRHFLSLVVDVADNEQSVEYRPYALGQIANLSRDEVIERIVTSGLWTALRTRPFGKIPSPASAPHSVFVNAMDTNPLAPDPGPIIQASKDAFEAGLIAVRKLTDGLVYVCRAPGTDTPGESISGIQVAEFSGPHPAGLVGTHMHFLKPVSSARTHWHLNYQDVIAIGIAFIQGRLDPTRILSLAGPAVKKPRWIRTRLGASIAELTANELRDPASTRIISGSLLCGRQIEEWVGFLGRYHLQVSCLPEGNQRELLGWQMPGFAKFSATRAFAAAWMGAKSFALTTSTEGSKRAMVPIGTYEKVMPMDLLPTLLLRALIVRDTVQAQELGCLELEEEDLGLCTFVCPGKYEYASILRENLSTIENEG